MRTASPAHRLEVKSILKEADPADPALKFLYGETCSRDSGPYEVIGSIRSGFPKAGVDAFLEKTGVGKEQLSRLLQIRISRLDRYTPDQRLPVRPSDVLYELTRIYLRALDMLGDPAAARHWLGRKQPALGNQTPFELSDTTEGFRLVDDLLSRIGHGGYS